MTVHRLKLKELEDGFLKKLKAEGADDNTELAIWITDTGKAQTVLSEAEFWNIIDLIDRKSDTPLAAAITHLAKLSTEKIKAFEEILAKKLYDLDGEKYAREVGGNAYTKGERPFSADSFLYTRCAVVAAGRDFYEEVLSQPKMIPDSDSFERILSLSAKAYYKKEGKDFDYFPAYIYETFSNPEGWEGKTLIEILAA